MAFNSENRDSGGLARPMRAGLKDGVDSTVGNERGGEPRKPSLVDLGVKFCRDLRSKGDVECGSLADKAFIDELYVDNLKPPTSQP